jgi:hypothetical protein
MNIFLRSTIGTHVLRTCSNGLELRQVQVPFHPHNSDHNDHRRNDDFGDPTHRIDQQTQEIELFGEADLQVYCSPSLKSLHLSMNPLKMFNR